MAKRYFLSFLIRNQADPLVCEVRNKETDRLEEMLAKATSSNPAVFFSFDTVDGTSVAINLTDVQAVRFLWDPAELPPDTSRDNGMIRICLRGRAELLETDTESPDQLFGLFFDLEHGPDNFPYPSFEDEDGELVQLNAREIVWVMAPTHLLDEGAPSSREEGRPDREG